jgi:hypothetical protein
MPLIGRQLIYGSNVKLDDISSQFNGTTATFNLSVSGRPFNPGNAYGIIVSLSGVIQEPSIAYTVISSEITFSSPPLSNDTFFGYVLSSEIAVGVPGDRTITGVKLSDPFNYESGLLYLDTANRRVGIETTNPVSELHVNGTITETSSLKFKKNINPIENALDSICQISGVTYDRKDDTHQNEAGFVAEYINEVLPNIVSKDDNGEVCGINYTRIVAYLVEAIKELKREIEDLKNGNS